MAREDWETATGFADDFDFYIDRARFGFNSQYMGGTVPLLIWEGHSPDAEDVTEVSFPIGSGWNVVANGARIEHEEGKKKIVRTSVYGHLIERVIRELRVESLESGSPLEAATWVGYGFHLKREKLEYKGLKREGDKEVVTERLMPVALIAEPGKTTGNKKTTSENASPKSPSGEKSSPKSEEGQAIPSLLKARLIKLAKANERSAFQVAAMEIPEVTEDDVLLANILDDGPEGFWAKYHG